MRSSMQTLEKAVQVESRHRHPNETLASRRSKLRLVATITAVSTSAGLAYCIAFDKPFKTDEPQPLIFSDVDLEARDRNWRAVKGCHYTQPQKDHKNGWSSAMGRQ